MNIQPPDYDRAEQKLREKNKNEVRDLLDKQDSGLLKKISTFANRFGYSEETVCKKIEEDPMFACCFAKDPGKMKVHEKTAATYLGMFPDLIRSFSSLPAGGKRAKYINQTGDIITGQKPDGIKSLDFTWVAGDTDIICFAAHKFTRESGGHQDNQFNELIRLLQAFKGCNDKTIALFAICDGPYYNARTLSILRQHVQNEPPYSFACPVGDVPKNVEKLIMDQVK